MHPWKTIAMKLHGIQLHIASLSLHNIQSFGTLIEAFCYNCQRVLKILVYVSKTWKNSLVHRKESKLHLSRWLVHLYVMERVSITLTPPVQHLSIAATDLMILSAFSNLNNSMVLTHVRTHTCKRLSTVLIYHLCPGYLITDEHNFLILLFTYIRIFQFEFKHFHKLKNFSFTTASAIFPHDKSLLKINHVKGVLNCLLIWTFQYFGTTYQWILKCRQHSCCVCCQRKNLSCGAVPPGCSWAVGLSKHLWWD